MTSCVLPRVLSLGIDEAKDAEQDEGLATELNEADLDERTKRVEPLLVREQGDDVGLLSILVVGGLDIVDSGCTLACCSSLGELALRDDA